MAEIEPLHEHEAAAADPARAPGAPAPLIESAGPAGAALRLQRSAGNRATAAWASSSGTRLQRQKHRRPAPALDTLGTYMAEDDWARAATTLGAMAEADMRARMTAMTSDQRQKIMEGARHFEGNAWVTTFVTVMVEVNKRDAIVGSLRWARWKHEWARARTWFYGLSIEDARNVARRLDFSREQMLQVIGTDAYMQTMFPDVFAVISMDERMRYAMEALVGTYGLPVNGAAGIVGNLSGESGLIPSRLEGSREATPMKTKEFDSTAREFTPEEVRDRDFSARTGPELPGVGIAQWTSADRRRGFFERTGGTGMLFDMDGQLAYLMHELTTKAEYRAVNTKVTNAATTVDEATDVFLEKFERPRDPEHSRADRRTAAAKAKQLYEAAHPAAAPVPAGGG